MLSELMVMVENASEGKVIIVSICCWSDSQVALWWVKSGSKLWKACIQELVEKVGRMLVNKYDSQ